MKFICTKCESEFPKWSGRCLNCGAWDCIIEQSDNLHKSIKLNNKKKSSEIKLHKLDEIETDHLRLNSDYKEFDNLLGGGLVASSVVLFGGEPGIGKSTFLLQLVNNLADAERKCFYFSGEESVKQVQLRAKRIKANNPNVELAHLSSLDEIINLAETNNELKYIVIDSIQTMFLENIESTPGSLSQVRAVTFALTELAKRKNINIFLIAHVTKEGNIAGPKIVEHMVDVVLYFEGEKRNNFRLLRSIKNRYGTTDEVTVMEMLNEGLKEISNPSQIFLSSETEDLAGNCLFPFADGNKIFLLETQGLLIPSHLATPRRATNGFDQNRLAIIIAIIYNRAQINLTNLEVYFNITSGLKIVEPAIDLAVCCALISAFLNKPLPKKTVAVGEVGLSGEIRPIDKLEARIKEVSKLGYENMLYPSANKLAKKQYDINLIPLSNIKELVNFIKK